MSEQTKIIMWKFRLAITILFFMFMYRDFFNGNEFSAIVNGFCGTSFAIWTATSYLIEYIDSKFDKKDNKTKHPLL